MDKNVTCFDAFDANRKTLDEVHGLLKRMRDDALEAAQLWDDQGNREKARRQRDRANTIGECCTAIYKHLYI